MPYILFTEEEVKQMLLRAYLRNSRRPKDRQESEAITEEAKMFAEFDVAAKLNNKP